MYYENIRHNLSLNEYGPRPNKHLVSEFNMRLSNMLITNSREQRLKIIGLLLGKEIDTTYDLFVKQINYLLILMFSNRRLLTNILWQATLDTMDVKMSDRDKLKIDLLINRDIYCPICGIKLNATYNAPDMHEAILSKQEVRGAKVPRKEFNTRENCVLLCHKCHMNKAYTEKDAVLNYLINTESKENIVKWLNSIKHYFKSNIINEKINMVNNYELHK